MITISVIDGTSLNPVPPKYQTFGKSARNTAAIIETRKLARSSRPRKIVAGTMRQEAAIATSCKSDQREQFRGGDEERKAGRMRMMQMHIEVLQRADEKPFVRIPRRARDREPSRQRHQQCEEQCRDSFTARERLRRIGQRAVPRLHRGAL